MEKTAGAPKLIVGKRLMGNSYGYVGWLRVNLIATLIG
jgi:hypothetical protein